MGVEVSRLSAANPDESSTWSSPPSWLHLPPRASSVEPPVETREQLLPVDQLSWEDFERLCLRLLEQDAEVVHTQVAGRVGEETESLVRLYGVSGQAQLGIDVYARVPVRLGETPPVRLYVCLQARRIKEVTKADLSSSVGDFLRGKWSLVSRKFIYATSGSTRSTTLADESERLASRLATESVEFEVWDREKISARLKTCPELVDDFFGRAWVKRFCGVRAAEGLGTRLDVNQVNSLRMELAGVYKVTFGIADSGQVGFGFTGAGAIGLRDRFVTPDLSVITAQAAARAQPLDATVERGTDDYTKELLSEVAVQKVLSTDDDAWFRRAAGPRQHRAERPHVSERIPADQWISRESRQVIVGEPGAGKSTLLRFLVLDLLSEEPEWPSVAERWGNHLPVWLPFHFFTQRLEGRTGIRASVGEALKAWLEQHDSGEVWPLVEAALNDKRLLLVVDGLDEWVSDEAGRYGAAALWTFADRRDAPLIVSTRPYGLARLSLGTGWSHARIASLTPKQQRQLVSRYFRPTVDAEDGPSSAHVIERSVDNFMSQVHEAPDLRAIAGIPLFLVLLVGLHLSSDARLPAGRFEVYDRAVRLLVAEHPAQRRTAAAVTAPRQGLTDDQLRTVLARVAFVSQIRGDFAAISEKTLRNDFVDALRDREGLAMNRERAATTADQLLTIAEGELGLLVRKGPTELGFLHRMLQEQLAAEHISRQLSIATAKDVFEERVGDPRWREVLLATMWRLTRPAELRELVELIRQRVNETPAGLRARELLAELTFGPYDLPAIEIEQNAHGIIDVIETHPYGPHRARLLDSVLTGLDRTPMEDLTLKCLQRWTLLVEEPSPGLVRAIAEIPPAEGLSEAICMLLVRALRYPEQSIAYTSGVAIADRCSSEQTGNDTERRVLREELLEVVSDPPNGSAAAAALTALLLEWREIPLVVDILKEARSHAEEGVRVVALSEVLGVLRPVFSKTPATSTRDVPAVNGEEREWLIAHLEHFDRTDSHWGLLVAAVSEVARAHVSAGDLVDSLHPAREHLGKYDNRDLAWSVMLNTFPDDPRVVELVCDKLRSKEFFYPTSPGPMGDSRLLASAYPIESPHKGPVSAAIEDRVQRFPGVRDMELFRLAAVDRGPKMRKALLDDLSTSGWPHWAATALAEFFSDDGEVRAAVHSVLMGEPVRASKIANVASQVLGAREAIPRLLDILRELDGSPMASHGRYDIVASALVQARREQGIGPDSELEAIATEALALMSTAQSPLYGDPRYELAAGFYPSEASRSMLAELAEARERPLAPYLRAFREEPEQTRSLLGEAEMTLRSLPAYLRGRVCGSLAEGSVSAELVLQLTRRWADDVSASNKSIASLAYHRALLKRRQEGHVDDCEWNSALTHLGEQASCYGPDHPARRRAAWVGICVAKDWSVLEGRVETNGEAEPVGISLADPLYGPDTILLQQIASCWEDLRKQFGDTLLTLLSGIRAEQQDNKIWDSLALVAPQNPVLQQELESAVTDNSDLLKLNGVLAWFVIGKNRNADTVADALVSHLQTGGRHSKNLVVSFLAEPERIGLSRGEVKARLENSMSPVPASFPDPTLEGLTVVDPKNRAVHHAWQRFSTITTQHQEPVSIDGITYFAVAYAAIDAREILDQIARHLEWLGTPPGSYHEDTSTRYLYLRLRRDEIAAATVRDAVMDPTMPDARAALLVSLLAETGNLDSDLLNEVDRRLTSQKTVALAPFVRDHTVSATLSVRTIFRRVEDTAWRILSS